MAVTSRLPWTTQSDTLSQKKSQNKKEEKDGMVDLDPYFGIFHLAFKSSLLESIVNLRLG